MGKDQRKKKNLQERTKEHDFLNKKMPAMYFVIWRFLLVKNLLFIMYDIEAVVHVISFDF